jgi:radical SAM protein with 4Fe4S-binding SPASM domain
MFVDAGVFHVVLSGGEPLCTFDLLEYALKRLKEGGLTVSCNSNLMLATDEKMRRLREAGLDHVLTSLNSHDPAVNDYMVNQPGAFNRIIAGIELARRNDIRVSANMIVCRQNMDHVYQTGRLAANLGCQRIFGTRVVPCVTLRDVHGTDYDMEKKDALYVLDELVRVKDDAGIMIGSLVSYPLCLLGDLERYADFVGRGCPAQRGHRMNINANGDGHACVHESISYGNVFQEGLVAVWRKFREWHAGEYLHAQCRSCAFEHVCNSGCRMSALALNGSLHGPDPLMCGPEGMTKPYKLVYDESFHLRVKQGVRFRVPQRIRFRREDGYCLLNIRWANTIMVENSVAQFLERHKDAHTTFDCAEFGSERSALLAELYFKDAVESDDIAYDDERSRVGLSADLTVSR